MKRILLLALLACAAAHAQVGPGSPSHFLAPSNAPLGSYASLATLEAAWPSSQLPPNGGPTAWIEDGTGTVVWTGSAWVAYSTGGGGITALTGEVTASGSGSQPATIAAAAVTLAKMANETADTMIGNNTGSAATPLYLTAAQIKTFLAIANTDVSGLGTLATQNGTFSGTSSGTNTGDQTIILTGAVTGSGTGSFATTYAGTQGVATGGTGLASYTIGDMLYASGATTLSKLADVATGSMLTSGGIGVAPLWASTIPISQVSGGTASGSTAFIFGATLQANGLSPTSNTCSGNRINLPATSTLGGCANGTQSFQTTSTIFTIPIGLTLSGLTTGTNADTLCLSAGGVVQIQAAACTISSVRFKMNVHPWSDDALRDVMRLETYTFNVKDDGFLNQDPNAQSEQIGLTAESVAAVEPRCSIYESDMKTPKSYRQECVIAVLVKAAQQQQREIDHLWSAFAATLVAAFAALGFALFWRRTAP